MRYTAVTSANTSPPVAHLIALRELLRAFEDKGLIADLCSINAHILDHAVSLASARKAGGYASRVGVCLAPLSRFLRDKKLAVNAPVAWQHGHPWPSQRLHLSGKADERRAKLLPSQDAIDALPQAFLLAEKPGDVILASVMALLVCAPSRVNEVFALPEDCEIKPLVDGEDGHLLRWAGSKGYRDFEKTIPGVMTDLARTAIDRIRAATGEARHIALWYENHPTELYLPDDCAHLRGQSLSAAELSQIIGFTKKGSATEWAESRKIARVLARSPSGQKMYIYRFEDIEREILGLLPRDFPIADRPTGLKYSQALTVVHRNEFGYEGSVRWRCMITLLDYNNVQRNFHFPHKGIFIRLGLSTPEHPVSIRTNQLRHYLNTLAQTGGLSEVEIAAWSGRKDIRQNAAYDHRTPDEVLASIRMREKQTSSADGRGVTINSPVNRTEAAARAIQGHSTDLGFCEHDFASSPCARFMECLHCTEHSCVKGLDPHHLERVSTALQHAQRSLIEAEAGVMKEYEGAIEWATAHRQHIIRLEQLHAALSDPQIPDGSIIRLSKSDRYSVVEQAMLDQGMERPALASAHSTLLTRTADD
ncbi:hypothetical protein J2Z19_001668 [Ensifer adhaerens]|uniref:Uncharacterized protein n=1 Tax=Ensifer adhaerens TaxID=106592 RepID=A0ACC5SST4_ENSAD|nr:hypothetical protein [Ensifer adhaerens]MBP1871956.1 hypothetical protein [Ensifer adhaerens]